MSLDNPESLRRRGHRMQIRHLLKAEESVRSLLHTQEVDPRARPHMERAIAHLREATTALQKMTQARSVPELLRDLECGDRLVEKIQNMLPSGSMTP